MRQPDQDPKIDLPPEAGRSLELLATGLSMPEVAARLGCPVHVVLGHLSRAIVELGATSKLDAIVKATRLGLIDLSRAPRGADPTR